MRPPLRPSWPFSLAVFTLLACSGRPTRAPSEPSSAVSWEPPDSWDDTTVMGSPSAQPDESEGDSAPAVAPPPAPPGSPPPPSPRSPLPGTPTVAISKRPMPVGTKMQDSSTLIVRALYGVDTGNGTMTVEDVLSKVEHRLVEVLGVDRGEPSKVAVSYEEKQQARINNGRERRKSSPVEGKTYLVEWVDGQPRVSDPRGGAVPPNEAGVVASAFRDLGEPSPFVQSIPSDPLPVGTPIPALAQALKREVSAGMEDRTFFGKVRVTPEGTRNAQGTSAAAFGVLLQLGVVIEDARLRMNLRGEVLVRRDDAWPLMLDVSGPVAVDGTVNGVAVHGRGTARLTSTHAYP